VAQPALERLKDSGHIVRGAPDEKDSRDMPTKTETVKTTPQRDLRQLADQCDSYKHKAGNAMGNMRELIGEAVLKKHLHKGAFSAIMRLRRMDPEDLAEWKLHFDSYWDRLGLERIANQQSRMSIIETPEDEDDKVTRMPRKVRETAGEAAE
jgi:uncharacterized protein (UPF0335 family)